MFRYAGKIFKCGGEARRDEHVASTHVCLFTPSSPGAAGREGEAARGAATASSLCGAAA